MKRAFLFFSVVVAWFSAHAVFEHAVCERVSLDGEWEMAYSPYEYRTVKPPEFAGVKIANAVPEG